MSKFPTYARCRLILGMANVGFWVCLSSLALSLDWPSHLFATQSLTGFKLLTALAPFLAGYIILQAPFDMLGGVVLPILFRRLGESMDDYIISWLRGVFVQTVIFLAIAWSWLSFPTFLRELMVGWMTILLLLQLPLAWIVGVFYLRSSNAWKSLDDAFTGGVVGFPGMQSVIFATGRGPRVRAIDERRRRHLQKMGLANAGIVIAVTFNLIGFLLISTVTNSSSVAGLVEMVLWFTIWSFLGLLILPSLSRPAVYTADYVLYAKGMARDEFVSYVQGDPSQAGEETRSSWVERIFHPVPSVSNRVARWGRLPRWSGGWHAARYALFLSWAGLSLINRAVHCNVGKPNVWVMPPCD